MTRQLLAFNRTQVMGPRALDLSVVVANLDQSLKRIAGEHIQLRYVWARPLPPVQANSGLLEQVLRNLVVNARNAMPHGGQLVITTAAVKIDGASAHRHSAACSGQFVCLEVADTGTGITPGLLPRMFEPSITTQDRNMRTERGLLSVYKIVQQHQGWINVSSHVGTGTTVRILLPAIPPHAASVLSPQKVSTLPWDHR